MVVAAQVAAINKDLWDRELVGSLDHLQLTHGIGGDIDFLIRDALSRRMK